MIEANIQRCDEIQIGMKFRMGKFPDYGLFTVTGKCPKTFDSIPVSKGGIPIINDRHNKWMVTNPNGTKELWCFPVILSEVSHKYTFYASDSRTTSPTALEASVPAAS